MTDNLAALFFISGLIASLCKERLRDRVIWWIGIGVGFIGGGTAFLIKAYQPKQMNIALIRFSRLMVVTVAAVFLVTLIWGLIHFILNRKTQKTWTTTVYVLLSSTGLMAGLIYILPQVLQYTTEFVYFGEESISTMALLRATGFLLGLLLVLMLALGVYKVNLALSAKGSRIFMLASLLIFAVDYFTRAVAALQRLRAIPLSDIVFQIMIFGDNYYKDFIYGLLAIGLVAAIGAIIRNRKAKGKFKNNALKRKQKAKLRNRRRWGYGLVTTSALVVFILSVVYYYETKEVELTPPQPYQVEDTKIIIDLKDIDDGHLHRFSYKTPNGYDVRFIAVKKPQGQAYGLGLDACEICGIAGYFERGDEVVCKRCDVVMNKATIGFKGGCNPIPFPYVIKDAKVVIDKKDLEREEKRFK